MFIYDGLVWNSGIYGQNVSVGISTVAFDNMIVEGNGGAIYGLGGNSFIIANDQFSNIVIDGSGGAIYTQGIVSVNVGSFIVDISGSHTTMDSVSLFDSFTVTEQYCNVIDIAVCMAEFNARHV